METKKAILTRRMKEREKNVTEQGGDENEPRVHLQKQEDCSLRNPSP